MRARTCISFACSAAALSRAKADIVIYELDDHVRTCSTHVYIGYRACQAAAEFMVFEDRFYCTISLARRILCRVRFAFMVHVVMRMHGIYRDRCVRLSTMF